MGSHRVPAAHGTACDCCAASKQGARGENTGGDFFVENVIEELDFPSEFYYDKRACACRWRARACAVCVCVCTHRMVGPSGLATAEDRPRRCALCVASHALHVAWNMRRVACGTLCVARHALHVASNHAACCMRHAVRCILRTQGCTSAAAQPSCTSSTTALGRRPPTRRSSRRSSALSST
jgi:hypothetical protein